MSPNIARHLEIHDPEHYMRAIWYSRINPKERCHHFARVLSMFRKQEFNYWISPHVAMQRLAGVFKGFEL